MATATALLAAALVLAHASAVHADAQTKPQQSCINAINKSQTKLAAAQGKANAACVKSAGKSKLPSGQTAQECVTTDSRGKVDKAAAKVASTDDKKCQDAPEQLPDFGYAYDPALAMKPAVTTEVRLLEDLLDVPLQRTIVESATDKAASSCQAGVVKAAEKYAATLLKNFDGCKKAGLKDGTIVDASGLEACVTNAKSDLKGKAEKARDKIEATVDKKCAGSALTTAFLGGTGSCGIRTGSGSDFAACVAERANCRTCQLLDLVDDLAVDCEAYDDGLDNISCLAPTTAENVKIPSAAEPAETPGTPGVVVTKPELIEQFGGAGFSLNNANYTRWRFAGTTDPPDAILIVVAGFGGGANNFKLMAENLIPRVLADHGLVLEVWGFHRRTNQLEDREGIEIAKAYGDPEIAVDWYYGDDIGLTLAPELVAGPNRRAHFYNTSNDIPFIANFTTHVYSKDIDAVVEAARTVVTNDNVFLAGHSAGTGFVARYAATDFDEGAGVEPGYAKLRGLVLLEGGGGSTGQTLSADTVDRIVAKADGGLFGAVRDNAARCVDGTTPCTIATEAADCFGQVPDKCTEPVTAYSAVFGLSPQVGAASEPAALQARTDPDSGLAILQQELNGPGSSAIDTVPELALLSLLPDSTVDGLFGAFLDDDGVTASLSPAVATGVGSPGPVVDGKATWLDITEGGGIFTDNGPAPTTLPGTRWGVEVEEVRIDRMATTFLHAGANASDWYYSSSGLDLTSVAGRCESGGSGLCTVGDVGAACASNADCSQGVSLDSSTVSATRPDIVNLTQAGNIDIPVICFGGSNGLTPVAGAYTPFGSSIATCTAPSCDGSTPRVIDAHVPNDAFPTFGDVAGGFEVHVTEGFAHNDVTTAEDDANNGVLAPLSDFIARNVE